MFKGHLVSLVALAQAASTWAATVTYNWDVTWVTAAPDGFSRPVIGINGQWPNPPIKAAAGDTVVVNMKNSLGNETTGLHFHGMSQLNSNFMDGASMVNQCPVPPGSTITYTFIADAPGTYWYHSHNMGQYPDGLRGPLIVSDPKDPYAGKYDEEVVLTVSDWYHSQTLPLVQEMLQPNNTHFLPPIPDAVLVNEGGARDITFEVGKTYRVRIISFAALGSAFIEFGSHQGNIIMIDGSYVQPQEATLLRVAPAQRYDLLLTAVASDAGKNFPYLVALDVNPDFSSATPVAPIAYPFNLTGYLVTSPSLDKTATLEVDVFQPFDDSKLNSFNLLKALPLPTKTWTLDFNFCVDVNGIPR
jgi:iron transport multicopper oxidase